MGFEAIFVGGWRDGVLGCIVEEYKYQSVWALGDVLVEVLEAAVLAQEEEFWRRVKAEKVVVVPLPTIGRHVRERGLDHTWRMGRKLAKKRGWKCERVLERVMDTVQVGAKANERREQAKKAYIVREKLDDATIYILLDDVWTTGASMSAALEVMKKAGAKRVMGVVVAVGRAREE